MPTLSFVVQVEAPTGVTSQRVMSEIASNLQSVNELQLRPGFNVVACVDVEDVRDALKRKRLLATW